MHSYQENKLKRFILKIISIAIIFGFLSYNISWSCNDDISSAINSRENSLRAICTDENIVALELRQALPRKEGTGPPAQPSTSRDPEGKLHKLPKDKQKQAEFERVKNWAEGWRRRGKKIAVVQGLGFVGFVMGLIMAASGKYAVIGLQRPSKSSFWKIIWFLLGKCLIKSEDPEVERLFKQTACEEKSYIATWVNESISLADTIVVDVQCDFNKTGLKRIINEIVSRPMDEWLVDSTINDIRKIYMEEGSVAIEGFEQAIRTIGRYMHKDALVVIETTVPVGTTELVVKPILEEERKSRGITDELLLAHSFERVMPGRDYVMSIRDFWRVASGINNRSKEAVKKFLLDVLTGLVEYKPGLPKDQPTLRIVDSPRESELTKLSENKYRAGIFADLFETYRAAEESGADATKIIMAIADRPTRRNISIRGPGIGGYCLTKDSLLMIWALAKWFGINKEEFILAARAIIINDMSPLHMIRLAKKGLDSFGKSLEGSKVALFGAAYRRDVGDTRYSPSWVIAQGLLKLGAKVWAHDPYVEVWPEAPEIRLDTQTDIYESMKDADVIMLAMDHKQYRNISPTKVLEKTGGRPVVIVDCFNLLTDEQIIEFIKLKFKVLGFGKGHIKFLEQKFGEPNKDDSAPVSHTSPECQRDLKKIGNMIQEAA